MHGTFALKSQPASSAATVLRIGQTVIDPSRRRLEGPGGATTVEPRVMNVLLQLADAGGAVVSREDLLERCWHGRFVGDDALNRAIGEVRRLARTFAGDDFAIETISRSGYRLIAADDGAAATAPNQPSTRPLLSRRLAIGGGLAVAAGVAGAAWQGWSRRTPPEARTLADQAAIVIRDQAPGYDQRGVALLARAQQLAPHDEAIAGRLALAWAEHAELSPPHRVAVALERSALAAQAALAIDPRQPEARTAEIVTSPVFGDWLRVEQALRAVLSDAPQTIAANAALTTLLMSVGRVRASAAVNMPLSERNPLSPLLQFRRVYNLWNMGRIADMDRTADRAVQLWPRHPGVWFARMWTLAFTGRADAAVRMIDDVEARPPLPAPYAAALKSSMQALARPSMRDRSAAIAANLAAATASPSGAINGIMVLTALDALDDAYRIADGYLRRQGAIMPPLRTPAGQPNANDQRQRKTMMLFVPVTAPFRADPRFDRLCEDIGLEAYWRRAGVQPDFRRR